MSEAPPNPGARLEQPEPGIALLTLDRPRKLNALTDDTVAVIGRLLDGVAADPKCRVLIITGAGRGFCSGFDLGEAADAPGSAELGETPAWMMHGIFTVSQRPQQTVLGPSVALRPDRRPLIKYAALLLSWDK